MTFKSYLLVASATLFFATPSSAAPPHNKPDVHNELPSSNDAHHGHEQAQTHKTSAQKSKKKDDHGASHWTYTGHMGPERWGELSNDNIACSAGIQQSPIDISHSINAFTSAPQIDWEVIGQGEVVNNGHTLQMNLDHAGGLVRDGKAYKLVQFHFHAPSEHTFGGRHFPMEGHFVHQASDGSLAVIGVMFAEGASNEQLDPMWWSAPTTQGHASVAFKLDLEELLPKNRAAYRYQGSLTTPPCSEIVDWTVMQTPLTVSKTQITAFKAMFGENNRPTQPLHRRFVLSTPN